MRKNITALSFLFISLSVFAILDIDLTSKKQIAIEKYQEVSKKIEKSIPISGKSELGDFSFLYQAVLIDGEVNVEPKFKHIMKKKKLLSFSYNNKTLYYRNSFKSDYLQRIS